MAKNSNFLSILQSISMVVVYLFTIGLIFVGGWFLLNSIFVLPGGFLALYVIIFLLGGSLLGAWLWVLIKLPSGMARAFDPIKNKIASRQIASAGEFAVEIGKFMVDYFSFFRFDVVAVQIKVKDHKAQFIPREFDQSRVDDNKLLAKSKKGEEVISTGAKTLKGQKCFSYLIPIWFGKEWLGYINVFSDTRLSKINLNFLKEFEELYVDDQLMHVLYYESTKLNNTVNVNGIA